MTTRPVHSGRFPVAPAALLLALSFLTVANTPAGAATPGDASYSRDLLKALIAVPSTHEHGTVDAARLVEARMLAAGFARNDVQYLAPAEFPQSANVVVRLRGNGKAKPILYLCHLDVVEALASDWTRPPFQLTEDGGWYYGRGTIDMKSQDAAVASALVRLKHEGFVPPRDIIVAFTADEEAGGASNGVAWLLKQHRDAIDAEFVVNPDGGEAGMKNGRRLYVGVETSEKVFLSFDAEATDKGGHSSRPTPENPIYRLSAGLERLSKYQFPIHMTDTTRLYFERRAPLESGQVRADMQGAAQSPPDPTAVAHLAASTETDILLRTTCTATQIAGGHAENALPQRAHATIQCRVIPGESADSIQAALTHAIADPSITLRVLTPAIPSPESPPSPAILATVERVSHSLWPNVVVLPQMAAGASDSIYTRNAGIPSYGIDGAFDDLDDGRAHGRDERIGVTAFDEETEFTYRLMRELASGHR